MPHEFHTLADILVLLASSIPFALLCFRLGIPTIVGFMLAGMVAGPGGLAFVTNLETVQFLAEVGVIFLLFTVGLEFSLQRLNDMRRAIFVAGGLQVALTIAAVTAAGHFLGYSLPRSVFFGFLISLSSTALVVRILSERGEIDSPHGRPSIGILLFQDLCIVPMMLFVPMLAGGAGVSIELLAMVMGKAAAVVLGTFLLARFAVPRLLRRIVKTRSSELFVIMSALVALGTSLFTAQFGLSLALGAFLAGLVLAESEYSHRIISEMLPLRDIFSGIFFVSLGTLFSLEYAEEHIVLIATVAVGITVGKAFVIGGVGRLLGLPQRVSFVVGLVLAQVGEFSFVLAKMGLDSGILGEPAYQCFVSVSVISMLATPFLIGVAPSIANRIFAAGASLPEQSAASETAEEVLNEHVIVIGYGMNGRNLHRVLKRNHIAHTILELNGETVRRARAEGVPIEYGDALRRDVLAHAGLNSAKVVVVAISDPHATRHITKLVRDLNSAVHLLVRTRYMAEVSELEKLGADQVIPEEFETSIEIFSRVLREYGLSRQAIQREIDVIRSKGYQMLRSQSVAVSELGALQGKIGKAETRVVRVEAGSAAIDQTLASLDLRNRTGASVIGAVRDGNVTTNPGNSYKVSEGDVLLLFGHYESVDNAAELFRGNG